MARYVSSHNTFPDKFRWYFLIILLSEFWYGYKGDTYLKDNELSRKSKQQQQHNKHGPFCMTNQDETCIQTDNVRSAVYYRDSTVFYIHQLNM